jgi:uncharacterized protein (DUF983 family)
MSPSWRSFLTLHDRCPRCAIPFNPGRGESSGGVELATYVVALLGGIGAIVVVAFGAPWWAVAAWVVLAGVLAPCVSYRNFRGLWVGAMFAAQPWGVAGHAPHVAPVEMPPLPWDE